MPLHEILSVTRSVLENQEIPIHRVLVVFGERVRDAERAALAKYQSMLNFDEHKDLFSLVLTKCEDMDIPERDEYAASFLQLEEFAGFSSSLYGPSILTGSASTLKRTICVGLRDVEKIQGIYPAEERDRLLSSVLFFTKSPFVVSEGTISKCCVIL